MQTKEHLLYFFLSKSIRLHYSDRKFFNNLTIIIKDTNTITTGQTLLFDKLIEKYLLQLKQTNLTIEELLALPWKAQVVETSKEYTSARVTLVNGILEIKVPMNNKFIRKFDDINDNPFIWEKNKKAYVAPFNTNSLKVAHSSLPKYFSQVVYCNQVKEIISNRFNPDGFNVGININSAAGQTVPHVHIHLIPRYNEDVVDPIGGVRNVIPSKGNYLKN
jgi:hypothetical protein